MIYFAASFYLLCILIAGGIYYYIHKNISPWNHGVTLTFCLIPWGFLVVVMCCFSLVLAGVIIDG